MPAVDANPHVYYLYLKCQGIMQLPSRYDNTSLLADDKVAAANQFSS